jgi:phage terminase small subunit
MTAEQETLVAEYLTDLNATQAAIRAGYAVCSRRSSTRPPPLRRPAKWRET